MYNPLLLWVLYYLSYSTVYGRANHEYHPVILVPGDGGCQIYAKLNRKTVNHFWCQRKSDGYFRLWLSMRLSMPYAIDCTVDNLKLQYNTTSKHASNVDGVDTRIPGFGNTSTVESVDPGYFIQAAYFSKFVKYFVKMRFKKGFSIRAAPYDFRKAANDLGDYYQNLKELIENTYEINDRRKVVLVGHSLGAVMSVYFLNKESQEWKDKYMHSFVSVAAPFGGSVKAFRAILSGDNFGIFMVKALSMRPLMRSSTALISLIPSKKVWNEDEVIVRTTLKNYTINDLKELFADINYPIGYSIWQDTNSILEELKPPRVRTYCFHGIGLPTEEQLIYSKNFPNKMPKFKYGDGDGTVNLRSLELCKFWKDLQKEPVHYETLPMVGHFKSINLEYIMQYVANISKLNFPD